MSGQPDPWFGEPSRVFTDDDLTPTPIAWLLDPDLSLAARATAALVYAASRKGTRVSVEELKASIAPHGAEYLNALAELVAAGYASPDVLRGLGQ